MFNLPRLKQIKDLSLRDKYASSYEECSGLPIPKPFLHSPNIRVFGVFYKKALIGGFILGNEPDFRSLNCFAQPAIHPTLKDQMGPAEQCSEICCFFIAEEYRTNKNLNLFTWYAMTYAIRRYGKSRLLFGTNKVPLARLYGQTHHSRPFHEDRINGQRTFLFIADRKQSVKGMLEIIKHKQARFKRIKAMQKARLQSVG